MRIIAKAAPYKPNIKAKMDTCKYIELQLLEHFNNIDDSIPDILHEIEQVPEAQVVAVHTPICKTYECKLDYIDSLQTRVDLVTSADLAEAIGDKYNRRVKLIMHYEQSDLQRELFRSQTNDIFATMRLLLYRPHVDYCIENVTPLIMEDGKLLEYRNGNYFENCHMVEYLRRMCQTRNIYTVLDICHAKTTIAIQDLLIQGAKCAFKDFEPISLEDYFRENQPYIGLIHLNDVKNLGVAAGEHGTVPDEQTLRLFEIFYKKYNYNCDITLEVYEDDYLKCDNFKSLYPRVKELFE